MMKAGCGIIALRINDEDYLAVIGGLGPVDNNTPPQPGAQYREDNYNAYQRCNEVHLYRLKTGQYNMILGMCVCHQDPLGYILALSTLDNCSLYNAWLAP